jgi:hypothetical protein
LNKFWSNSEKRFYFKLRVLTQNQSIPKVKVLICTTGSKPQSQLNAFIVLLRDTTWKCGVVERLVVNYLRQQFPHCGCTQTSVDDMLEHFKSSGEEQHRFSEAMDRLEKRGIIKIVSKPFSSSDET